jgi:SNF2 family DNA or RNA helicase
MSQFIPVKPQQLIIEHLAEHANALLFVGMGVGKTAACLYQINELLLSGEAIAALIVAPMRVANLTWPSEVRDWAQFRWMRVANLRTESGQRDFLYGRAHLYLVNYESLHHLVSLVERRGGTLPYDVCVFDELTRAKNPGSKRINLYRRKVPRAARQWGLTGTPMPNSHIDLFAQVRLVDDGVRLGTSFTAFKQQYFCQPAYLHAPWKAKDGTAQALEQKISDITITLRSSDWLDIPDTVVEDVEIHFTPELQEKYEILEEELVIELCKEKTINVTNSAALITKLIQFTSGCMYDDEKATHPIHSLKFEALEKIVKKETAPIFVATMYKHEYVRMREHFPESVFFNEAKSVDAQNRLMKDWNAGKIRLMFAHPASVGHGLNLQYGGSILVYPSLTHNREWYEQLICRFARRGQTEITKVYRLMVPGTVDDAVAEALANKASNEARLITALQMLESYRNTHKQ